MEKPKILIVEDEGVVALQLKLYLEKWNYAVSDIFASGEETLDKFEELSPDLVLMDMNLQGKICGIETADVIRRLYGVPIIYLTAHSGETTVERAKATEPYGYILKPFNAQELRITIEVALYKHKIDKEKEKLTQDLRNALDKVKMLSGMLPICASCKKIRDDKGYWTQIESYISEHSEAEFSHGICPDCAKKLYPDIYDEDE